MKKYELWLETEFEDGGRYRRKRYFDTREELDEYLDRIEESDHEFLSDYEIQIIDDEFMSL